MADNDDIEDLGPAISQKEAALRQQTGSTADGRAAPANAMVDTQTPAANVNLSPPPAPAAPSQPIAAGWLGTNDEVNASTSANVSYLPPANGVKPHAAPGPLDTAAAAFRQHNLISSFVSRFIDHPDSDAPDVPGYTA